MTGQQPRDHDCPYCKVFAGHSCKTRSWGQPMKGYHAARVKSAARAKPRETPVPDLNLTVRAAHRIGDLAFNAVTRALREVDVFVKLTDRQKIARAVVEAIHEDHEALVLNRVADECEASAQFIEACQGEVEDGLAEAIWSTCEKAPDCPATLEDPRTIAQVAYLHFASELRAAASTRPEEETSA